MNEEELVLRVGTPQGRELRVDVLRSPCGEASEVTNFPYADAELKTKLEELQVALLARCVDDGTPPVDDADDPVRSFGRSLFNTVFTGETRSVLDGSLARASANGTPLRIQLQCESPQLAALPWEFLHHDRFSGYLALSRLTPLVRYVPLARPQKPLRVKDRLRVLAMAASPAGLPELNIKQEQSRIEEALADLKQSIELHWLDGQQWRDLQDALQTESWHAFHFIGHGKFDSHSGEGLVALEDADREPHYLRATELGILLGDHESLRLAVLNSCEGARSSTADIFSSTAGVLVERGTPAVVAMQYEITDDAAIELSRSFYTAIAHGLPVDAALTEARKSVALALPGTVEWGVPVLHLRADDGHIFRVRAPEAPTWVSPRPPELQRKLEALHMPYVPPARRNWRRLAVPGVAAAVALLALALFVLRDDGGRDPVGLGSRTLAVPRAAVASHVIELPDDSVALVTAVPRDGLDPDLAVLTSRTTARDLTRYLFPAGFDDRVFIGALDEYRDVPDGHVVSRTDEFDVGEAERIVVLAPRGGRFTIVVGGAGATDGRTDLLVRLVPVEAPGDGLAYLDRVLGNAGIRSFVTPEARAQLGRTASINIAPAGA
jgi:hypothetical protein